VPLVEINSLFPNGGEQTRIHIHVIFFAQQKIFLDFGSMEDSFLQKWMGIRTQVLIVRFAKTWVLHKRLPTFDDCHRCKKKVPFSKRAGPICKP
jgi:hypothetical protein